MGDCMARRLLMETHGAHCLAYGINCDTICPPLFVSLRAHLVFYDAARFRFRSTSLFAAIRIVPGLALRLP